jgi:hypothetical protein
MTKVVLDDLPQERIVASQRDLHRRALVSQSFVPPSMSVNRR